MSDPSPAAPIRSRSTVLAGGLAVGLRGLGRGLVAGSGAVGRARRPLAALLARVGFWGALLLWCTAAIGLVSGNAIDVSGALTRFVLGAAICAVVTLTCEHARVRWTTALVGSLHGVGAVTLWLLV